MSGLTADELLTVAPPSPRAQIKQQFAQFCVDCIARFELTVVLRLDRARCAGCQSKRLVFAGASDDVNVRALLAGTLPDECDDCGAAICSYRHALVTPERVLCALCKEKGNG